MNGLCNIEIKIFLKEKEGVLKVFYSVGQPQIKGSIS